VNLLERIAGLRLLVVTGKGGVGKSTLTAALGRALTRIGRRTLLLEIDPRESLYRLLGVHPSGGDFVRASEGLYVQNVSPREVLDTLVRHRVGIELVSRRVLASPIYDHFVEAAPGLKEVAALGHARRIALGLDDAAPDVDTVVLDAPATGHGVSMLAAPRLVSEAIGEGPFAHMGEELGEFLADPAQCGILIAAAAEEMPVRESVELIDALDARLHRRPEAVLVNLVYPEAVETEATSDPTLELWTRRRRVNDEQLRRLRDSWHGPCVELPLLPLDQGAELSENLGALLQGELEALRPWS
jgi:anion-transporting  ArsA/GET3 family ATPase